MSDGMTDLRAFSLAAERRQIFIRSLIICLEDYDEQAKHSDAINDIMAFQNRLYAVPEGADRETAARGFLSLLRHKRRDAWVEVFSFILRDCANDVSRQQFEDLKSMSPFRGKTLVVSHSGSHGLRLTSIRDLENHLAAFLAKEDGGRPDGFRLIALDCSPDSVQPIKA